MHNADAGDVLGHLRDWRCVAVDGTDAGRRRGAERSLRHGTRAGVSAQSRTLLAAASLRRHRAFAHHALRHRVADGRGRGGVGAQGGGGGGRGQGAIGFTVADEGLGGSERGGGGRRAVRGLHGSVVSIRASVYGRACSVGPQQQWQVDNDKGK